MYMGGNMNHTEFIREQPGSRTAILFIHGILGTPNHFNNLIRTVPETWSVYNILLDGHGKTVDDFAAVTMETWKTQVHKLVSELSGRYEQLVIAAHSMGTLFAIQEALDNRKIRRLFLIGVPLNVRVRPGIVINSWKVVFGRIREDDAVGMATKLAYSITPDRRLWKYLKWIPNYLALFAEIRSTRSRIADLCVPCVVFQSENDELVAVSSAEYFRGNDQILCRILPESGHFYYEESDAALMERVFHSFTKFENIDMIGKTTREE